MFRRLNTIAVRKNEGNSRHYFPARNMLNYFDYKQKKIKYEQIKSGNNNLYTRIKKL